MLKTGPISKETILSEVIPPFFTLMLFGYLLLISFANGFSGLSYDEAYWTYVGQHWLSGDLMLYKDMADNKPPAIHFLFGLSTHLVGPGEYIPRLLGSLAIAIAGFFIYRIATVLHNYKAGLIALIIFAFSVTWKASGWRFTAQTESFVILCSTAAIYLLLKIIFDLNTVTRRRLFSIGVILGIGLLFKQTAIFGALTVFVLLYIYSIEKYLSSAFWIASGIVVVVAPVLLIPIIQGVHPELILQHLFSAPVTDVILPEQSRLSMLKGFARRGGRIIIFGFGIAFLWQQRRSLKSQRVFLFLLIWVALEIFALSVPGNYASYQMRALLPALAVTFGIGFMAGEKKDLQTLFMLCLLLFSFQIHPEVINTVLDRHQSTKQTAAAYDSFPSDADRKQLGLWIKKNTSSSEIVYIAGYGAQVQAYSERRSPARYFSGNANIEELRENLRQNPPDLLLIPAYQQYREWIQMDQREWIAGLAEKNYTQTRMMSGYLIYREKSR